LTSDNAPQPPGGPLREDSPDGGLAPDAEHDEAPPSGSEHGSDDDRPVPPVSHEPTQTDEAAALQQENAETSLDQPSS
jgi:hypothetical protein